MSVSKGRNNCFDACVMTSIDAREVAQGETPPASVGVTLLLQGRTVIGRHLFLTPPLPTLSRHVFVQSRGNYILDNDKVSLVHSLTSRIS